MTTFHYKPFDNPLDFDAMLAFHRNTFGDARMEGEGEGGDESTKGDENPDAEGQEGDEESDKDAEEPEPKPEDELPEWARNSLSKANDEAAKYRKKLREAEEKLANAKTPDEVEQIVSEMKTEREKAERSLLVENVALKFNLPDELAARLQGATREELETDAKSLAKFAQTDEEPGDLNGGLNPSDENDDLPDDPGALARRVNRGRRTSR